MHAVKPFVVTRKRTGIGSDLASAASGYSLAVRTGRDLVIDWRHSLYLQEPDNLFGRLFDVPESIGSCRIVVPDRDLEPDLPGRIVRFGKHDLHRLDEEVRHDGTSLPHHSIITTALRDPRHLELQKAFLAAVTPKPHVVERIEEFHAATLQGRAVAGIHLRHGNGENLLLDRNELSKPGLGDVFSKVHHFLDSADPRPDRILVCSDSHLVREQFRAEFRGVVWFDSDVGKPDEGGLMTSVRGIRDAEEAVIEMWLLARCDFLLFNPSWFSHYAQCLGRFRAAALNLDDVSIYGTEAAARRKVDQARSRDRRPPSNPPAGAGAPGLLQTLTACLAGRSCDPLHARLAEAAFLAGRYDTARARYRRIRRDPALRGKARLMDDWIRFHQGDFSTGWPRYPGADFDPPAVQSTRSRSAGWRAEVADPRQPRELAAKLGMRRWRGGEPPDGPLLVWFNFKDSLGGEILASRLVGPLLARHPVRLVLACADRLVGLLQASFPDCLVVNKAADLVAATRGCGQYVLARDLLGILVAGDDDFRAVAAGRLRVSAPATVRWPAVNHRPRIALSWKTTNGPQGRYRNIPLADLASVLAEHDLDWHVAQHGDVTADLSDLRRLAPGASIVAGTLHPLGDMASFANELLAMDAVVTVDNTLLHLAGGLRIPTLALISAPAYWAWPSAGTASRWYASVTLLRHAKQGAWGDVVSALSQALRGQFSQGTAGVGQSSDVEAVADQTRSRTDRHPA